MAALHHLYRGGDGVGDLIGWSGLLLLALTALGGGIKLAMWGARPITAAVSDEAKARLSEPLLAVVASVSAIVGALGMWWAFRRGYSSWWQHLTGERGWSLSLGVGQMLVAVLAGAALFTGGRYVTGLAKEVLTDSGLLLMRDRAAGKRRAQEGLWHPGLVAALIGGGLGLVLLTAGITPRLYVWITGPDVLPAIAAIAGVLLWAIGSNLGWWKGLAGLWKWATDASQKATAAAGVIAVLMFSATGLGLGWFTPATVPQAHAACPPDCGGPGGSGGPPGGGQMFQPPSQGGPQMPDYQGGINQPPMDQNNGISIYNTQAPSISNNGANGSNGQGPQQGWDQPAHGTQPPDYQNATPYTQGPGRPNPDYNPGGQSNPGSNPGSQGGQPNQGVQQPPQQDAGQQPNQQPQQSDQQKIDDLTRQLQDQQQQSGQDRQRLDDLTRQLQQQKQNQKQQSTKFPSKDKKKDDKDEQDEQDDRDKQSGDNDLTALLLGAASTRRRKQDEQQGPDTEALGQDASQAVQGLPGDVQTYVQSGQQIGQSSGQAAQGFGSAAQAGASLASSAQSGAVNPQDAVTVVQGVSQGIQGTADAVNAGSQIVKTAQGEADQVAQAIGDANPQLKPQTEQFTQLNDTVSKGTEGVGQVAGGVSQVSGMVNTGTSMGTSGAPDISGTATAVSGPTDVPKPPTPPTPPAPSSGVQALDSTTTRAPQQPALPQQPPGPSSPDPTAGSLTGTMGVLDKNRPPPEEYKPAWGEGVMQQFADGVNGRSDGVVGAFNGARNLVGLGGEGAPGVGDSWKNLAGSAGEAIKEHLTTPPIVGIVDGLKHNLDEPLGQYVGEKLFDGGSMAIAGPLGGEGAATRAVIGDVATTEVKALPGQAAAVPAAGGASSGIASTATQIGQEVAAMPKGGPSQTATLAEKLTALQLNQAQAAEATNIASKEAFGGTAGIASLPDGTKMVLPRLLPQKVAMQVLPDGSVTVFKGDLFQFLQYLGK
ncbi:hypothetical protein ABQE45_08580 [Mycobacteroides chelonae]